MVVGYDTQGAGLGLVVAAAIAQAHGALQPRPPKRTEVPLSRSSCLGRCEAHAATRWEIRAWAIEPRALVAERVDVIVRAACVAVRGVVVGPLAAPRQRIRRANGRHAVAHRNPVRAGKRAEIRIERTVLLHDHDHVPDLVNAARRWHGRMLLWRSWPCERGPGRMRSPSVQDEGG